MSDSLSELSIPPVFKGIALLTPGGDFFYCIDSSKQSRWHIHLCAAIQERLELPEPPHFLVPCYCATIDRWIDPQTGGVKTLAEAYPPVFRYQALLNAVFGTEPGLWKLAVGESELCNPLVLAAYRETFPQLWESHEWVVRVNLASIPDRLAPELEAADRAETVLDGYVLRLFIKGYNPSVEATLLRLHELLETSLGQPYTLKIIDVLKHPDRAEADRISTTPTLIRLSPPPVRRIVGELNDIHQILSLLDIARTN
jgi:circadian clock protein KaiB